MPVKAVGAPVVPAAKASQPGSSEPVADSAPDRIAAVPPPRAKPEGVKGPADDDNEGDDGELFAQADDQADQRDYWKGVHFDVTNFDEVLDYVDVRYIDPKPDKQMAWVEAANFALLSLEPGEELLPEPFFKTRAGLPAEEGRLDGRGEAFTCKGQTISGVILHHLPTDEYLKAKRPVRKKGRLSDEEVKALRDRSKARTQAYHDTWHAVTFDRPQFECVMHYVGGRIKQIHTEARAAKEAAKPAQRLAEVGKSGKAEAPDKPAAPAPSAPADLTAKPETAKSDAAKEPEKPKPLPDMNRAWEAAASGFLYALDPHSAIIPRKAWDDSTDKTQDSSFEGIGAVLTQRDDQTIVENPMEGRPAWRSGIRAGDVIQKVDGTDVSGMALNKVVKMIRGPRATAVKLTITRENDPEPKDYSITRESIEIKNVDGKLVGDYIGIAHVKMTGFIPNSTKDLRSMIDRLAKQAPDGKVKGLVLDLRNNSGGLLNKAIEIGDAFLPSGRVVSVRSRGRDEEMHEASSSALDYTFPVVVLVNDGSASASEIVASALQDNGRALVIGQRTFGKASVQTLYEPALHYDYYIKLTVARYYAPSGYTLQVIGVQPDIEVAPHHDGKMPVGFREENLNNHLVPLQGRNPSPWQAILPELAKCVTETGLADKVAKRDPKPQIQPDYQLLKAADYLTCLAQRPKPTAK
ncbi:MAG: S41 family peptidase [Myxococcales bacterium]|nr:S41 family peptidase [Myxococcales bacterium]